MARSRVGADVHMRLPHDMLADLRTLAEYEDRTIAAEMRRALRQYLEQPHIKTTLEVAREQQDSE